MAISVSARTDLISIVVGMFNAAPGAAVLSDLTVAFEANQTRLQIATNLAKTAEYLSIYPEFLTNAEFATKLVDNMVGSLVSAAAKADAVTLLTAQLNAKNTSTPAAKAAARAEVSLFALDALKAVPTTDATLGAAVTALNNKVEVATFYSVEKQLSPSSLQAGQEVIDDVTNTAASVTAAKSEITGESQAGSTSTLTTNPDNITGTANNDTINAYLNTVAGSTNSTFTAADVINGGDGTDSLKLTVEGNVAGALPNATISNVEQFFIRDVGTAASTYNFGSIDGETQVWADTATNAVTFSNLGTGAVVGLRGNNVLTNLGNVSFSMATASNAVSIAIDGGVKNTVAPTITNTGGTATTATISSTGAANTVGTVTLAGSAGNTITTLNINAETALTATLVATDYAATAKMVVTGAGNVTLTGGAVFDGATIDGSASTGNLNFGDLSVPTATVSTGAGGDTFALQATAKVTVNAGAGNDSVTLKSAIAAGSTINLGAGNDRLLVNGGSVAGSTSTVIDGGEGVDTVAASLINAANASQFKNFENIDVSSTTATALDIELMSGSTITGLTLTGGTGGATVNNVASAVGLSVAGGNTGTTTIGVKGAATSTTDTYAVTFAGAAGASAPTAATITAGTVVVNNVENLTINSAGAANTWNSITVTDDRLKVLKITGDKNLDLAFAGTNGTNGGTGGAVSSIDGSEATGRLNINTTNVTADSATAGLTVKGGSGQDTITLAQKATVDAGAGNDTITVSLNGGTLTGGAGTDKFDVAAAVSTGTTEATAVYVTITDFAAGDSVKLLAGNVLSGATLGAKTALDNTVTNIDLALAVAALTDTANEVSWFQYGTNTYIVANNGTAGFAAGDLVIKLTGLVDLTNSTLDTTTDYLTFA